MEDDEYEEVIADGKLKLKGGKIKKKKKKKKKSKADDIVEHASQSTSQADDTSPGGDDGDQPGASSGLVNKTKAELAYEKAQEKRAAGRILKKASKTHKQRVEELNEYLGGLSEHYDIQKVSWTK